MRTRHGSPPSLIPSKEHCICGDFNINTLILILIHTIFEKLLLCPWLRSDTKMTNKKKSPKHKDNGQYNDQQQPGHEITSAPIVYIICSSLWKKIRKLNSNNSCSWDTSKGYYEKLLLCLHSTYSTLLHSWYSAALYTSSHLSTHTTRLWMVACTVPAHHSLAFTSLCAHLLRSLLRYHTQVT